MHMCSQQWGCVPRATKYYNWEVWKSASKACPQPCCWLPSQCLGQKVTEQVGSVAMQDYVRGDLAAGMQ